MATAQLTTTAITSTDRFGLTLILAVVIHAIIILGVTFTVEDDDPSDAAPQLLEIILVHQRDDEAPEDADYLAQANLEGGGSSQEKLRPTSPMSMPDPLTQAGLATDINLPAAPPQLEKMNALELLTLDNVKDKIRAPEDTSVDKKEPITAVELIAQSMEEIANLSAEIDQARQAYSQITKHRYISANTREYRDAAYLDAWRSKVERIGNLNYPEAAKRRDLSGNLLLDVAINADGSINDITLRRSSGHKILDDAAIRIVRLAAPYAAFPTALRKDTDVLHIIRTWQFMSGNRLKTSR